MSARLAKGIPDPDYRLGSCSRRSTMKPPAGLTRNSCWAWCRSSNFRGKYAVSSAGARGFSRSCRSGQKLLGRGDDNLFLRTNPALRLPDPAPLPRYREGQSVPGTGPLQRQPLPRRVSEPGTRRVERSWSWQAQRLAARRAARGPTERRDALFLSGCASCLLLAIAATVAVGAGGPVTASGWQRSLIVGIYPVELATAAFVERLSRAALIVLASNRSRNTSAAQARAYGVQELRPVMITLARPLAAPPLLPPHDGNADGRRSRGACRCATGRGATTKFRVPGPTSGSSCCSTIRRPTQRSDIRWGSRRA